MKALATRFDERRGISTELAELQAGLDSALRLRANKTEPRTGL
jgi:hypothetical protein